MDEPISSTQHADESFQAPAISLRCKSCGAALQWDPDADALTCAYCQTREEIPREDRTIVERPLSAAADVPLGLGTATRALRCQNCGACVALDERATSERCAFCGSPSVLAQEANRSAIRPESLIPLDVGRSKVDEAFGAWIRKGWFRPSALARTTSADAVGLYVPAWTFDCRVHSVWRADSGTYYYVTEHYTEQENGRTVQRSRQVQKVHWWPSAGERTDAYDDLQVLASRGLPAALAERLGEYDTSALVPYRPEYLAGWRAEEYELDLQAAWSSASERIAATQRSRCASDVPGDTHRDLKVRNDIADIHWKHVLLPLWSLTYTFADKSYPVFVHGQSGRIVGEKPVSWRKIVLFVVAILALGAGIAAVIALAGSGTVPQ